MVSGQIDERCRRQCGLQYLDAHRLLMDDGAVDRVSERAGFGLMFDGQKKLKIYYSGLSLSIVGTGRRGARDGRELSFSFVRRYLLCFYLGH